MTPTSTTTSVASIRPATSPGVAAGLKSLEMGNNSIGYVAAYNREYAETCSGINAFALGVQAVNPDAVVHVNKISTWGDENLERQAAQALIDTYDCCVIGQHCDSAQPQLVAAENNVFGCGYNSDMTEQAPNAHLTAAIWHWDVYYQAAIETAMTCGGAENFVTEMGGQRLLRRPVRGLRGRLHPERAGGCPRHPPPPWRPCVS